ncbi:MAG: nucleotidyl transferase AbiEii/AbiGii toxin family protein [Pseudoxanthomonas sp.]
MSNWDKRYAEQVKLLVDILPVLAREPRFALKGGTAINLFEHDLPRLSVDIDLTWLPVGGFANDSALIADSLLALGETLRTGPMRLQVQASANQGASINRIIASRGQTRVKIETSPVMRGSVHPVRSMTVQPAVEAAFGFAEVQVLHFADLYAGKLAAALSRQHPRDLFDMGAVVEQERLDVMLWRTFLIYLTCSPKPAAELLAPAEPRDFTATFAGHFEGMTAVPTSAEALLAIRARLLARMRELLDDTSCKFLVSVEREAPDFDLLEMPQAATLPAVRHKLQNLGKRSNAKRDADQRKLRDTLEQLRGVEMPHRGNR